MGSVPPEPIGEVRPHLVGPVLAWVYWIMGRAVPEPGATVGFWLDPLPAFGVEALPAFSVLPKPSEVTK